MTVQVEGSGADSILAVDIGTDWTHAALIDTVEGEYRYVASAEARSTWGQPEVDVEAGVRSALWKLSAIAGHPFLDNQEELIKPEQRNGSGVDALVVTCSAAPPLRVLIAGLTRDLSVETATRCAEFICSTVYDVIVWDESSRGWDTDHLQRLYEEPPDVVLLVGGVDMGPVTPLVEMARVLAATFGSLEEDRKPVMLFAANQDARRPAEATIGGRLGLRVVDNVRPTLDTESISEARLELEKIHQSVKIERLPGFERLKDWCEVPALATAVSLEAMVRFLNQQYKLQHGMLALDIGSYSTHVMMASDDGLLSFLNRGTGCGRGIRQVMDSSGLYSLLRWVPIAMRPGEARTRLANMEMRPASISQTTQDLMLVQAVAREATRQTLKKARSQWPSMGLFSEDGLMPPLDLIVVRGGVFSYAPHPGQVSLMVIDAVQPIGVTRLVLDWASMLPQLGALARFSPLATAQVTQHDALMELGTVVSPIGRVREGQVAVKVNLQRDDGTQVELKVPFGAIRRIPLRADQTGILELRPHRTLDIGMGKAGIGVKVKIRGGALGIIIDARGRPLELPIDNRERLLRLQQWFRLMQP